MWSSSALFPVGPTTRYPRNPERRVLLYRQCAFGSYHSLDVCVRITNVSLYLTVDEFDNTERGGMPLASDPTAVFLVPA